MYEVIAAFLGLIGILVPVIIKLRGDLIKERRERLRFQKLHYSNSFTINFRDLNEMNTIIQDILEKTPVDRFLLLSAVNGKDDFNFVSALYEQHVQSDGFELSVGATSKYIDLSTDDEYKKMLKYIEQNDPMYLVTQEMEHSMLKNIYLAEDVKYSLVCFVLRIKIDDDNDRVVFCSWSTHSTEELDANLKMRLRGATERIKMILE